MDIVRKIALLQAQVTEANAGEPADFTKWRERTDAALRVAMGPGHPVVERFGEVRYTLSIWTDSTPESAWRRAQISGVKKAIAILEGAIHELQSLEAVGPSIDVGSLHRWITGAVAGLWDDGHHRQAVDEATRSIEVRMRSRLNLDLTGTKLVTEAFNPDPPRPGKPRLRFRGFSEGSQAWINAHRGAMHFAQGCMLRIRNLIEHHDADLDEQIAIESLAALSLLARWVEEADLVSVDDETRD